MKDSNENKHNQAKNKNFRTMSYEDFLAEDDSTKLARLVYLQKQQANSINRILNNVLWFFTISIISLIGAFILVMNAIDG